MILCVFIIYDMLISFHINIHFSFMLNLQLQMQSVLSSSL